MRYIFTLTLTVLIPLLLAAQSNPSSQESDSIADQLSPVEYAFMMHEEPGFMLRLPFLGVGAEVELLPYFTLVVEASQRMEYANTDFAARGMFVSAELRWYYGSRNFGRRNMSGNYFFAGAGVAPRRVYAHNTSSPEVLWLMPMGYFVGWGMQRRVLGQGLIDMGLMAEMYDRRRSPERDPVPAIRIGTRASFGLGLVFGQREPLDWNRLCPWTNCGDVQRFMVKINTMNLLGYEVYFDQRDYHQFVVNPNVGVEYKIAQSSFSVNANMSYYFAILSRPIGEETKVESDDFMNAYAEGRWYYNLKRRMKMGKAGNGLSANYISAGVWHQYRGYHARRNSGIISGTNMPYIATGVQRTFGKHLYLDAKIGLAAEEMSRPFSLTWPIADAQVGFRF